MSAASLPSMDVTRGSELAAVGASRTRELIAALRDADPTSLDEPSLLPGWTKLTIVCHLRYGARAVLRMTGDALAGRPTAYYPGGRDDQRPHTLRPEVDERPSDVIEDWEQTAASLEARWATVGLGQWAVDVVEPPGNPDLGTIPLARLAFARLTEIDVHGTDLGIGFPDWSPLLVDVGLPTRLSWLATRRTNHRFVDASVQGSWLLVATTGLRWLVSVDGDRVTSHPAQPDDAARGTIQGTARDLFAMLLGRSTLEPLRFRGDVSFAKSFHQAFPAP